MCYRHTAGAMRTHKQIITDAGGYKQLAVTTGQAEGRARFWERRESIPPDVWPVMIEKGLTTLEELSAAHAQRKAEAQARRKAA